MTLGALMIPVILLLVAGLLTRAYNKTWGYWPGGALGTLLAILVAFMLLNRH